MPADKKILYVVAISQGEAKLIAHEYGHDTRDAANKHLAECKAPPTDPYYANQFRVYKVIVKTGGDLQTTTEVSEPLAGGEKR